VQRSGFRVVELEVAHMSGWQHLKEASICVFNFKFSEALMETIWAVCRVLKVGDYGANGYFTRLIERERWNNYEQ
jgi:hypothetical protein